LKRGLVVPKTNMKANVYRKRRKHRVREVACGTQEKPKVGKLHGRTREGKKHGHRRDPASATGRKRPTQVEISRKGESTEKAREGYKKGKVFLLFRKKKKKKEELPLNGKEKANTTGVEGLYRHRRGEKRKTRGKRTCTLKKRKGASFTRKKKRGGKPNQKKSLTLAAERRKEISQYLRKGEKTSNKREDTPGKEKKGKRPCSHSRKDL